MSPAKPVWLDDSRPKHDHSWLHVVALAKGELVDQNGLASNGVRILSEELNWKRPLTPAEHLAAAQYHAARAADMLRHAADSIA
jgi:hypothetical protein